jgi:tetratricopeptide (TPR) repeat protein
MKVHPHGLLLEEFVAALSREQLDVVEHLVGCEVCRARLGDALRGPSGPLAEKLAQVLRWPREAVGYEPVFERVEQAVHLRWTALDRERAAAPALLAELVAQPVEKRPLLARNQPRFQAWGLLELLLDRGREQGMREPGHGEDLARLALDVADCLDASYYGAERIEDLRARAWGCRGNARRVISDFHGAEEAFRAALRHLRRGTGDPLERAILLDVRTSLLIDQRRFADAMRLLRRTFAICLEIGERHRAGKALVNMDAVHHYAGTPEKGIPLLYQALELIDPERDPFLVVCAWHNLIDDLAEAGRFLEAQKLFLRSRPLYARAVEPAVENRRRWVEGKIARGLGRPEEAEGLFRSARDAFVDQGIAYDAALASLDLATLYAEQGRTAELKRVAEEMVPIFSSRQIHREALAALTLWRQAVVAEEAGRELVAEVAAFLKRAQYNPELRFRDQ